MLWMLIAAVIVAAGLFFFAKRSEKGKPAQEAYPYQKSEALFTPTERSFLGVLQQAVGSFLTRVCNDSRHQALNLKIKMPI
jgi:hypothetical protein